MNTTVLERDLANLSYVYYSCLKRVNGVDYAAIKDFNLPPGYNYSTIPILLKLPRHYPEAAPGVGSSSVYVPSSLRYKGKQPTDFHPNNGPTKDWAWWCYERIDWNPHTDDLITFFELLRAHMTNPPTKG